MSISDGRSRKGGPIPKFRDYHIWKTLWCLSKENPLGRKALAAKLGVGEGSTRTILAILQEAGLILIRKNGVMLTPEGKSLWNEMNMEIARVDCEDLTIGPCNIAVQVPRAALRVGDGRAEMDSAIKAGADGATTLIFNHGNLIFPENDYPISAKSQKSIRKALNLRDEDAVIIGTASDYQIAEEGAVTAALDLIGGFNIKEEDEPEQTTTMGTNEIIAFAFMVHDLVGGLPTCAKPRDGLGVRIENGRVVDNAYTGAVMEEVIEVGTTIRRIAVSGPYKGIRVIVSPVELDNKIVASIGVVDIRSMAGINNPIRLHEDEEF